MPPSVSGPPVALDILARFALAQTIFAAHELGIWEPFLADSRQGVNLDEMIRRDDLSPRYSHAIIDHLVRHRVLRWDGDGLLYLDDVGRHLVDERWLAYIVFYVGGYGKVLEGAGALARQEVRYGENLARDGYYVALGTEMMSETRHHRSYEVVFDAAKQASPERVLDLGCGSARFLSRLVRCTGASYGLGVDRDAQACELARHNVAATPHIEIYHGDMHQLLDERHELAGSFDVVTAMMVIHESFFLGEEPTLSLLCNLRQLLTPEGRLLILDKHIDILEAGQSPPYLTEYKLVHDLTNQDLYTLSQWRALLPKAGLRVVDIEMLPPHTGSVLMSCRAT